MARHRTLLCTAVLTAIFAAPLAAQGGRRVLDWQYRWYWGAKAGMTTYTLPTAGRVFAPTLGGDWLIIERRAALYVGYSQSFTAEQDTFQVTGLGGSQDISFDGLRRIQLLVVAMVGNSNLQPYAGGGFSIHQLSNARLTNPALSNPTIQAAIDDAATGAFLTGMFGVQYRMGPKLAVYGSFQFTPQGKDFLLQGGNMNFEGGVRYALMASREEPTTNR